MFWLVNLYSLLVYIEHNGDESPKDLPDRISVAFLSTLQHVPTEYYDYAMTAFIQTYPNS